MGEGGASLSPGLQQISDAIRDYVICDEDEPELVELRRLIDRLEVIFSIQAGRYGDSGRWDVEGYTSPMQCLRYDAHMAGGAAADRVKVGLHHDELMLSIAALHRGEIGFPHLAAMAQLADNLETRGQDFDERPLLKKARQQMIAQFRRTCDHARHAQDPQGFAEDEAAAFEKRFLQVSPQDDGSLWLKGWLPPEQGSLTRSALEPLARPAGKGDDRSREQRMADALVEGLTKDLKTELIITCTPETLAGLPGAPAAETEWGALLSADAVQRFTCGSSFRRLVWDGKGVIIDFGRSRRRLSPQAEKAVRAVHSTCVWPGCDRPARWCDMHHKQAWYEENGPTSANESAPLCRRHHRLRHDGGWQLYGCKDGTWKAIPPLPPVWSSDLPAA